MLSMYYKGDIVRTFMFSSTIDISKVYTCSLKTTIPDVVTLKVEYYLIALFVNTFLYLFPSI